MKKLKKNKIDINVIDENENIENIVVVNSAFTIIDKINAVKEFYTFCLEENIRPETPYALIYFEKKLNNDAIGKSNKDLMPKYYNED